MRKQLVCIAIAFFVCSFPSLAQETKSEPSSMVDVTKLIGAACPRMVTQLMSRPELGPVLKNRPISSEMVCACTETSFASDARLQKQFVGDKTVVAQRMSSQNLQSYFTMRLMHSVLSCLLPEISASLEQSDPAK
jgi:hypothetical protein